MRGKSTELTGGVHTNCRFIRNFFWSDFNRNRLKKYIDTENEFTTTIDGTQVTYHPVACINNYVYKYPYESDNLYNGDFNRYDVIHGFYPTRRYIDVGNVVPGASYKFEIKDCTYNTKVVSDDRSVISAVIESDEGLSIGLSFGNPISFIGPDSNSDDYANAIYDKSQGTSSFTYSIDGNDRESWDYNEFHATSGRLAFVVNPIVNDYYDVYVGFPKVITVMPFKQGKNGEMWDGISYIKTASPNGEVCAEGNAIEGRVVTTQETPTTSLTVLTLGRTLRPIVRCSSP